MSTLKEAVAHAQCRRGAAAGTTKRGAYWLATDPIVIRRAGGDGIGQSGPDISWTLELRHYRSGEVRPTLRRHAWHQNGEYGGAGDSYYGAPELAELTTIEEVIVALKGTAPGGETCYSDQQHSALSAALAGLGVDETAPAPDDAP